MAATVNYFPSPTFNNLTVTDDLTVAGDSALGPTTVQGGYVQAVFVSAPVDLAATSTGTVVIAATPGYYFIPTAARWLVTAATGTQSTVADTEAGNNVATDNVYLGNTTPSNALHALAVGALPAISNAAFLATAAPQLLNLSTPVTLSVNVAGTGTGGYTLVARLMLFGVLFPV